MTSMQLGFEPIPQVNPLLHQGDDLLRLCGMGFGYFLEHRHLGSDQRQGARGWLYAGRHHLDVPGQCLSGEDDALIGFGGGHGGDNA